MSPVWKESFEIKSFNVDFQQKIKPSALMEFFQEVASNHAASLGAGYDQLMEQGLFWALSRLKVQIFRMPGWGETILFETWPNGNEGLLFRRDFLVYDQSGEIIVRGVSGWLLVSTSNMRPQRPSALGLQLPVSPGKKAVEIFPDRLFTVTNQIAIHKAIAYNEIDQNLHVNNTRYLDWVTDCFDLKHFQTRILHDFTLEFLAETHWGDEVELKSGIENEKTDIEAYEISSGILLFRATLNWKAII